MNNVKTAKSVGDAMSSQQCSPEVSHSISNVLKEQASAGQSPEKIKEKLPLMLEFVIAKLKRKVKLALSCLAENNGGSQR